LLDYKQSFMFKCRTIEVEEEDEDDYLVNDYDQELFDDLFVLDLGKSNLYMPYYYLYWVVNFQLFS